MTGRFQLALMVGLATLLPALALGAEGRDNDPRLDFFEKRIRPLLVSNCYNCHSAATNSRGGLRVDDRNGLLVGGGRGPAIVAGQPEKSLLLAAVRHAHAEVKMPPEKHLTEVQIQDLARWIQEGAAWPKPRLPASLGKPKPEYARLRQSHWAWQPLRAPRAPEVADAAWPRGDLDRFVLAMLEAKGLRPAGPAEPLTLLRRLCFDLTGLPPRPEEIEEFLGALRERPGAAVETAVDRLLASPAFGERWGRHWLDVARYGESTGSARNLPYPHAWRYRNYVIDAFNADKPFDRFVREQIAGDLLPFSSSAQRDEQLTATGFLALGVRDVNQRFKVRFVMDNIDEQIDTVSRAFLGLTVSCARCHDHKFDPIPTTDYYALAGVFHSSELCAGVRNKMGGGGLDYYDPALLLRLGGDRPPDPALVERIEQAKAELTRARAALLALQENVKDNPPGPEREKKLAEARRRINAVQADLIKLNDPALQGPVAYGAREATTIGDTEIRIRGEAEKLGPRVPRGYLSLLQLPDARPIGPDRSGRLELADWLTSPHNPLTPRVLVNRVWRHLLGQGLVASVDNFGVTGEAPSHPQLLDHLAQRFQTDGWSVKRLIRTIVLSRTYQLSADCNSAHRAIDPANRLIGRCSPRRLDAEEIRDAMLAAAGTLERGRPDRSPAADFKVIELNDNGPQARQLEQAALVSRQRSVYLPLVRGLVPRALDVFDFAEQGMVTGSRDTTTVAPQALYLLNDPFVRQQARALAARLVPLRDDRERVDRAYRLALGRPATAREADRARAFVLETAAAARDDGWIDLCHALLASAEFRYVR